jgi:heme a synthase
MAEMSQSMIDPTPAIGLALLGAALALLPLGYVAWRRRQASLAGTSKAANTMSWLSALTLTTLVLTFDLVLFGSFTRLTDSGLGCPDWPGCYGSVTPWGAKSNIDAAVAVQPDGPVTHGKAWIEMVHRYFAMVVGVLIIGMTVAAWRQPLVSTPSGLPQRAMSPWWATVTLAWVIVQGGFGALTVTMRLYPAIVTLHLLMGMGLLALLTTQVGLEARRQWQWPFQPVPGRWLAWLVWGALWVQIALGGWVSTNYAVLACQDFPTCQGAWWPAMDFKNGFEMDRSLGRNASGDGYVPFAALTAIHVVHRLAAGVVAVLVLSLAWVLHRHASADSPWPALPKWLVGLVVWQVISGVSNVVLGWPIVAAVAHVAGAAGFVVVLTRWLALTSGAPVHLDTAQGLGLGGAHSAVKPARAPAS